MVRRLINSRHGTSRFTLRAFLPSCLRAFFGIAALSPLAAIAIGCHTAHVAEPLTKTLSANTPEAQLEFWHTLATRSMTSNDEAFHGLLLYVDNKDESKDFVGRMQTLKSRKMIPANFNEPGNQAVSRGTLAVAMCRILEIKGGLMMHLTQSYPRYAVRELQFLDLYPVSSSNQTFSGSEFLGVIGRMEDYQRGNPANVPATVLPGEMEKGPTGKPL
jgi:hypothetical protein